MHAACGLRWPARPAALQQGGSRGRGSPALRARSSMTMQDGVLGVGAKWTRLPLPHACTSLDLRTKWTGPPPPHACTSLRRTSKKPAGTPAGAPALSSESARAAPGGPAPAPAPRPSAGAPAPAPGSKKPGGTPLAAAASGVPARATAPAHAGRLHAPGAQHDSLSQACAVFRAQPGDTEAEEVDSSTVSMLRPHADMGTWDWGTTKAAHGPATLSERGPPGWGAVELRLGWTS